jgi:hypothetical protein
MMPARRFPPPWLVEEQARCFVVIDSAGQKLAYVYFEDESGRRSAAKLLTRDDVMPTGAAAIGRRICTAAAMPLSRPVQVSYPPRRPFA